MGALLNKKGKKKLKWCAKKVSELLLTLLLDLLLQLFFRFIKKKGANCRQQKQQQQQN